jgi:hypothetical protein
MRKPRADHRGYTYNPGDLVVWMDVIDGTHDEVGIVVEAVKDDYDPGGYPLYIVMMPHGKDIVTGWDAMFVLVPYDVYMNNKKKTRKHLDNDDERVTLSTRSSH